MDTVAQVPRDIADLLPSFRVNRCHELANLKQALWDNDFGTLQHLGERMYALGNPYGFRQITTFGRVIREACAERDLARIRTVVEQYEQYLQSVEITIVKEPVDRVAWSSDERANAATSGANEARYANER
ncbi:MAG TPA: hypothetical protein VFJ70_15465 [Burkholderiales bacterium]|nr:hypothetical protein [Burkholderiales bacterium]